MQGGGVLYQAFPDGMEWSVSRLAALRPLDRRPICPRERAWQSTRPPRSLRAIAYLTEHLRAIVGKGDLYTVVWLGRRR